MLPFDGASANGVSKRRHRRSKGVVGWCAYNFVGILVLTQFALILALGLFAFRSLSDKQLQDELHQKARKSISRLQCLTCVRVGML